VLFTNGLYLWKGTPREAAVLDVLKAMMAPEIMLQYGKVTGRDPARATLIPEHARNLGAPGPDPQSYVKFTQEVASDVRGLPHGTSYNEWHTIVQRDVLGPATRGELSPQAAAEAAAPRINAILGRR
jgi:ABC-type glycerol-3-phosphate transport system substrate-binding protein